jgi:curved DNA-binding protein CbpA
MRDGRFLDYYEILQVSQRAEPETIARVFRHFAKRYHPDNPETGNRENFDLCAEAYETLTNPEKRAAYDLVYEDSFDDRLSLLDAAIGCGNDEDDQRVRQRLLSVLYEQRRRDVHEASVGEIDLERMLDCPREHIAFHVWYLREKQWLERTDRGLAITALGIDEVEASRAQAQHGRALLEEGPRDGS